MIVQQNKVSDLINFQRNLKIIINRNSLNDKLKIKTKYKIENMIAIFKKFKRLQFIISIFIVTNILIIEATKIKI